MLDLTQGRFGQGASWSVRYGEGGRLSGWKAVMVCSTESLVKDRSYRLYSLSVADDITGAESREFDCDTEALLHAQVLLAKHPAVEVWQTHRFVCRLDRADMMAPAR
jgi:hypothetical protein